MVSAISTPTDVDRATARSPRSEIAALAKERLAASGFLALRRVRCDFTAGCLTLGGQVPSFYLKQMAQTLVREMPGVARVDNRLEVADG